MGAIVTPLVAARLSLGAGVGVFGLKWLAFKLTGSVALYSDALESIVNIVAAGAALIAVGVSKRPPDANHPYGHTKAEYFSAVLEGILIALAALAIVIEAWHRLFAPTPPQSVGLGLSLSVGASALNGLLAWFLIRSGRAHRSPALVADGQHLFADVLTSLGVLAGVGLAWLTGWWVLDPLLAMAVAVNILWIGWRLVRDSVGGLMDEALPEAQMGRLQEVIRGHLKDWQADGKVLEVHDLRSRRAGPRTFVEFHLVVPGSLTVEEAHRICDRLEEGLRERVPGVQVTIHVEPEWKAKHSGFVVRSR
ncbi:MULTISPECIES: cation diffusion facilitator family transporter [unclassified Meiothermus]|uniref:cation diffusion facilitator family transporter n=1 Tax=unclassified Meiothermus TaxID=370471 RepID=UPI000D7C2355|nr:MULTISPECIES: cation diffusion facilitator family transporter [unclassified Meiothermus]PZA08381.1 cation-efflux pump [Meiothermus sp. Pnk-1]RYM36586.1 cation transporter [Meiothermus sp. PNK-Is4]